MYYLGRGGLIWFDGLRIGGISGIFKGGDYGKGAAAVVSSEHQVISNRRPILSPQ